MREDELDLAYRILDDDLLDRDGRRCGKVDDIEIEGEPGETAQVAAILVGPGAFIPRLAKPFQRLARKFSDGGTVRVAWDDVDDVDVVVSLKRSADELGLGAGDDRAKHLVSWIPGS